MKAPVLTTHLERLGPFDPADMSEREARAEARAYYVGENGYSSLPRMLTLPESQHKLGMSKRRSVGLTLAVASTSGAWNVCPWSTPGCRAVCVLLTAGKSVFPSVRKGRELKTRFLAEHPQAFVTLLAAELRAQVARYGPIDFRPNVASDIRWERIAPALLHIRGVRVYDYTKAPAGQRDIVANYPLTFSVSELEHSVDEALEHLRSGTNAAVVFDTVKGHKLPTTWNGFKVIDGDKGDSRRDDPRGGVVVGLRAKGDARGGESTGFVKEGVSS